MTDQAENGKFQREGVRKMKLYLIDEDESIQIELAPYDDAFMDQVRVKFREHRLEIGMADVEQAANGGLIVDLFVAGQWTDPTMMTESLHMKGFIRAEMRKD